MVLFIIYMHTYTYVYMYSIIVFTTEAFFEVAIESWPECYQARSVAEGGATGANAPGLRKARLLYLCLKK